MAALKFITVEPGARYVMMIGISRMPTWFVVSWDSLGPRQLLVLQNTVKVLILPGWMMSSVMEMRVHCLIVRMQDGEQKTVAIERMQVWNASKRRRENEVCT